MKSYISVLITISTGAQREEKGAVQSVWEERAAGFREFQDQKYLQYEITIAEKAVHNIRKQHSSEQKRQ